MCVAGLGFGDMVRSRVRLGLEVRETLTAREGMTVRVLSPYPLAVTDRSRARADFRPSLKGPGTHIR